MKNILVPTDFSECSVNALNYAGTLSKFTNSKIIFLHVYQPLIPATDVPVTPVIPDEEMEKEMHAEMTHIIHEQKKKHGWNAPVSAVSKSGVTFYEINNLVKEKNIDLIIMGMRGQVTAIDRFLGSNATEMIKKANCPLLLIPENASFQLPDSIAIAFDFYHTTDLSKIIALNEFIKFSHSKLLAFSIINNKNIEVPEKAIVYAEAEKLLKSYDHSIHFNVHHDVPEGILSFIDEHQAKMLVMFHHSHNIFARMFSIIHSKEISFNIKVPLLVINEKANIYPPIAL